MSFPQKHHYEQITTRRITIDLSLMRHFETGLRFGIDISNGSSSSHCGLPAPDSIAGLVPGLLAEFLSIATRHLQAAAAHNTTA